MEFVRVVQEDSSMRGKIFAAGDRENGRVKLTIPYYNISAGWMEIGNIIEVTLQDYLNEAGLTPSSSFAREELHSQWAMMIWNVSRARDIQTAERIVQDHMSLIRR